MQFLVTFCWLAHIVFTFQYEQYIFMVIGAILWPIGAVNGAIEICQRIF